MIITENPIKVIYIAGYGRSGSTLLDQMLGQIEGYVSVGELRHIWERGFIDNQLCSCGNPLKECVFWKDVFKVAYGDFENVNIKKFLKLKRSTDRARYIPALIYPWIGTAHFRHAFSEYAKKVFLLYSSIRKVSGCEVIVDSTKDPSYGYVLSVMQGIDLHVIHLVRDSRAVTYSWQRKKRRPEIYWKKQFMPQYSLFKSAMEWNVMNTLSEGIKRVSEHYVMIRYEDLVENPEDKIKEMLKSLDMPFTNLDFIDKSSANIRMGHTVSGNPSRFKHGNIKIQPDEEWKENMSLNKRLAVLAITWPLLQRYGYFGR